MQIELTRNINYGRQFNHFHVTSRVLKSTWTHTLKENQHRKLTHPRGKSYRRR